MSVYRMLDMSVYEIDHCTVFGPCSTRSITHEFLVCGEQKSRQLGNTTRDLKLRASPFKRPSQLHSKKCALQKAACSRDWPTPHVLCQPHKLQMGTKVG